MMNLKKMSKLSLLILGFLFSIRGFSQPISNYYYGQNAWMPDSIGAKKLYGKLHRHWEDIKQSGASVIRFGGITADREKPTNFQYIQMIDSIRAKGMEPIIQVSFYNNKFNASQAAAVVQYINVTRGKHIKYWIIGNEPDLSYSYTTASQVSGYFKAFASAMKAVDPTILTIGPECAWYDQNILNGLTTPGGPDDITGKDANGRYYLDIITFHTYPFNGSQTRAQVISKLMSSGGLNDNLTTLKGRVANCNTAHGRSGTSAIQMAITEANVDYQNSTTDDVNGVGANSFIGGQFVAEMLGIGMKHGLFTINLWSVIEGNTTDLNIGYIDSKTGAKKPLYWHFKMMADNLKGIYAATTSNQPNVKTIGSKNGSQTVVMVMNQELATNYPFTVKLNTGTVSGTDPLKITVATGLNIEYKDNIPAQSSMVFVFDAAGTLIKKIVYTLSQHALSNLPPTTTNYAGGGSGGGVATGIGEELPSDAMSDGNIKGFSIKVFPNPAMNKFTIEMNMPNPLEKKLQVELFDMMGRQVFVKSTIFAKRKEELDMSGEGLADGAYIVRVREEADKDNVRSEKMILFH